MAHIKLENVNVSIPVFGGDSMLFKSVFTGHLRSGKKRDQTKVTTVDALKDINLEFNAGDRVGLVGPNGAGKSTLLKVLAGIYTPTSGAISRFGESRCLFGLGAGIEPEATGWENIRYQVRRLDVDKTDIDGLVDEIAEFTELGDALDLPVRTYSQGMQVRLSFGAMTSVPADILLIDEIIGVGDAAFVIKAKERMRKFVSSAKIVLLASHSDEIIRSLCTSVLVFSDGTVRHEDSVENTTGLPLQQFFNLENLDREKSESMDDNLDQVEVEAATAAATAAAASWQAYATATATAAATAAATAEAAEAAAVEAEAAAAAAAAKAAAAEAAEAAEADERSRIEAVGSEPFDVETNQDAFEYFLKVGNKQLGFLLGRNSKFLADQDSRFESLLDEMFCDLNRDIPFDEIAPSNNEAKRIAQWVGDYDFGQKKKRIIEISKDIWAPDLKTRLFCENSIECFSLNHGVFSNLEYEHKIFEEAIVWIEGNPLSLAGEEWWDWFYSIWESSAAGCILSSVELDDAPLVKWRKQLLISSGLSEDYLDLPIGFSSTQIEERIAGKGGKMEELPTLGLSYSEMLGHLCGMGWLHAAKSDFVIDFYKSLNQQNGVGEASGEMRQRVIFLSK